MSWHYTSSNNIRHLLSIVDDINDATSAFYGVDRTTNALMFDHDPDSTEHRHDTVTGEVETSGSRYGTNGFEVEGEALSDLRYHIKEARRHLRDARRVADSEADRLTRAVKRQESTR